MIVQSSLIVKKHYQYFCLSNLGLKPDPHPNQAKSETKLFAEKGNHFNSSEFMRRNTFYYA